MHETGLEGIRAYYMLCLPMLLPLLDILCRLDDGRYVQYAGIRGGHPPRRISNLLTSFSNFG